MRKTLLTIILIAGGFMAYCQSAATDSVKQTINTLFDGMRKGDSTLVRSTFAKDMLLQSISYDKEGKSVIGTEHAGDFIKAVGAPHSFIYDERIFFDAIKIDDNLASVWTPYKFYLGDKFSHCGVDVFQLMRTADGWKIIYIVDTRRKDNCVE